ncbi:hypothetical protein HWN40_09265 [Methanolobus zinderi]|uniref:Uncharacterized protein n=1 Tax=Methanolobus zinderi TaxID=536044 RepID=A0A7D5EFQ7_9EURY|nr:hypothetical protein [Methanolobus zinderi]QLC50414.1 hypothetical protein HWN40_09265 [Methanolobus zinderi]
MRSIQDEKAFSSSLDSIFFLILISISAVILMPSLMAEEQYRSAGYVSAQDMDTHLLGTILSTRTDEFEYTLKPTEIAGLNVTFPEGSMLESSEETLYGREQKHRTFADIIAEDLVLGITFENNSNTVYLNPMAKIHPVSTEDSIEEFLDSMIGERYKYRFEARWHLVSGYGIGSEIEIGDAAPVDSFRQRAKVSLPLGYSPSREEFFDSMNNSALLAAASSPDPSKEIHDGYNHSIETASRGAAEAITTIIFPAEYLESLNTTDVSLKGEQLSLISSPDNMDIANPELVIALHSINYTTNEVFGLNKSIPLESESMSLNLVNEINDELVDSNNDMISAYLKENMSDEIDQTVASIINATDNDTKIALHEEQMESVYGRVNQGGADIILYLWQ